MASTIKTDLAAVLATLASGRIYPNAAPAKPATPYGVYTKVVGTPSATLDAQLPGLTRHLFQVDLYATTYLAAATLHQQLQTAMADATAFKAVPVSDRDLCEDETKLHRILTEWAIWAP